MCEASYAMQEETGYYLYSKYAKFQLQVDCRHVDPSPKTQDIACYCDGMQLKYNQTTNKSATNSHWVAVEQLAPPEAF